MCAQLSEPTKAGETKIHSLRSINISKSITAITLIRYSLTHYLCCLLSYFLLSSCISVGDWLMLLNNYIGSKFLENFYIQCRCLQLYGIPGDSYITRMALTVGQVKCKKRVKTKHLPSQRSGCWYHYLIISCVLNSLFYVSTVKDFFESFPYSLVCNKI